jgi:hypothetical protein
MFDEKQFDTVNAHKDAVGAASRAIMGDRKQREEFLADPVAFLKKSGVHFNGHVELTDRDRQIIKLVADPEIATMYNTGNIAQLAQYLRGTYPSLVNDPSRVAWTVADFEIAIEAVAIAVGVLVAPLRPADDFSELARLEAVQAARFESMEARMTALETQVQQLGGR